MARRASAHPTDVELRILRVLWEGGPAGLGKIHQEMSRSRAVAKTTVATMLGVMRDKKLVRRGGGAGGYVWSAAVNRTSAATGLMDKILDYVFDGSASRMVSHLVDEGQISGEELEEIVRLRKQQQQHNPKSSERPKRQRGDS